MKIAKMTICFLVLLGLPDCFATEAQPAQTLTLRQAFRQALTANPLVESSRTNVDLAESRTSVARSYLLPRVALHSSYTLNSKEVGFGGGDDELMIMPEHDWALQLTVRQPIYAGARDLRTYQQAKLGIEGAGIGVRGAENFILFQVGLDYLGVLEGEALLAIEERNLELARRRLRQATDFFEVGEVTRVDVLRADSAIKAAERHQAVARQLRETAAGRLRVDLGLDGPIAVEKPERLLPQMPGENTLIAEALASSPEIRKAQLDLEVSDLEIRKQRGAYLPIAFADAGWIRQKTDFPADDFGFVSINLSVPIFQGGEVRSRVLEAEAQRRLAELKLEDVQRRLRESVRVALFQFHTAETVHALAIQERDAAELEYHESFELYRAQETTSLDLEASELGLARAKRRVVTSEVAVVVAALRVYSIVGSLKNVVFGRSEEENPS